MVRPLADRFPRPLRTTNARHPSRKRTSRLRLERLEDKLAPAGIFAAGADAGGTPEVRVFDAQSGMQLSSFLAYDSSFRGGVRIALGDVSGDGIPDIVTAAGPGGGPHVKVFDGRDLRLLASFFAFDAYFTGGVSIAVGDVNGDGIADIVTGAGAGGGPHVRAFNVSPLVHQIDGPLGDFFAFDPGFRGGVNVATGNLDKAGSDELFVAAGPGGGPHVKALASDGTLVESFFAYAANFTGGVYIAAGDFDADGHADIVTGAGSGGGPHVKVFSGLNAGTLASFFAYAPNFAGGVRVSIADFNQDNHADLVTGAGPGGGPHGRIFDGQTLGNAGSFFVFDADVHTGIQVAGLEVSTAGNPAYFQLQSEIDVLSRVNRFVPNAIPSLSNWTSVNVNDSNLVGKNVYVIAHGWAPGFKPMVQAYVANNEPNPPLKWWQTLDTSLPSSPGVPSSAEMFYGATGDGIQISPTGLAYAITQTDANAIVLAYSWVDESATDDFSTELHIPGGAYLSEAYTSLNGVRLANALEQILPGTFAATGGKLHIIGHSHGSKVATVATNVLTAKGNANFSVAHLTILDSPEDVFSSAGDASNHLWYFLGALNIGTGAGATFVDNYISEFDTQLGQIQGVNPLPNGNQPGNLQNIVDVNLDPGVLFDELSFGSRHGYAFSWYGSAGLNWAQNPTPDTGLQWSPLIHPAVPPTLDGMYSQSWTEPTDPQFSLTANGSNTVTTNVEFDPLSFSSHSATNGASYTPNAGSGTVTLTNTNSGTPTFTGEFSPELGISGISFNFQFTNVGAGDQLVISVTTGLLHQYQIHFVMTGAIAGTSQMFGTLSLGSLAVSGFDHSIQMQLIPVANSGASVQVTNMQQFKFPIF